MLMMIVIAIATLILGKMSIATAAVITKEMTIVKANEIAMSTTTTTTTTIET